LEWNQAAFHDLYSKRADLKYKLSLPKGYAENPNKKWPLILWLHGAGPIYGYESVTALGVPRYVLEIPGVGHDVYRDVYMGKRAAMTSRAPSVGVENKC
jgi:hypothetical protein